jgi:hypothetical protein
VLNPLDEQQIADWTTRLRSALVSLRDSKVPFVEGVRRVLAIANEPRDRDQDFGLFVAIDSETDHLPSERARPRCSEQWLAQCDREAHDVEAFYREAVHTAIEQLLGKFQTS